MAIFKFFFQLVLTLLLAMLLQWHLPWWSMAGAAALVAAWFAWPRAGWAVAAGFAAGLVLWGSYALLLDWQNEQILSRRMGALLGGLSPWQLLLLTALGGGIVSGLGAWVGYETQRLWRTA